MEKLPCVYMLSNRPNGSLYIGVTSNLAVRIWQHRNKVVKGFSQKYNLHRLVWFEVHDNMDSAISREKQLKAGSRGKKLELIEALNPQWRDLYPEII